MGSKMWANVYSLIAVNLFIGRANQPLSLLALITTTPKQSTHFLQIKTKQRGHSLGNTNGHYSKLRYGLSFPTLYSKFYLGDEQIENLVTVPKLR